MNRGYTLIEIMVVVGIMVIMLAVGIGAFGILKGNRSVDGGINNINSILGRARAQAIGLGKHCGLMFYYDTNDDRTKVMLVQESEAQIPGATVSLDLADADSIELPPGISLQAVDDGGAITAGRSATDHYLGYNFKNAVATAQPTLNPYGPVILFDGSGRLARVTYGFQITRSAAYTSMGALLYRQTANTPAVGVKDVAIPSNGFPAIRSQVGFVLYDTTEYNTAARGTQSSPIDLDSKVDGSFAYGSIATKGDEAFEEAWLDKNATPVLINRYNGTTIRGE